MLFVVKVLGLSGAIAVFIRLYGMERTLQPDATAAMMGVLTLPLLIAAVLVTRWLAIDRTESPQSNR
ncbi:hypothetical protein KR51_00012000 [Rubidibacter lacunae KORDI 51-2]|uniref:Uncharacterized protein n=1 Tax=Rubidibacter lacunae KORDI 51-2 TaxID=582515 RepID=U5DKC2_9CHRO|nr:hypothetical protein [Rubidibacter lacunae]ERN42111.1 hypothetical protein KR51_00012000 [Rubidibacter lacunae KORDI 51-2]